MQNRVALTLIPSLTHRPLRVTWPQPYCSSCRVMLHTHSFDTPTPTQLQSKPLEQLVYVSSGSNYLRKIQTKALSESFLFFLHRERSHFSPPTTTFLLEFPVGDLAPSTQDEGAGGLIMRDSRSFQVVLPTREKDYTKSQGLIGQQADQ